jgi:hypothetical protein
MRICLSHEEKGRSFTRRVIPATTHRNHGEQP